MAGNQLEQKTLSVCLDEQNCLILVASEYAVMIHTAGNECFASISYTASELRNVRDSAGNCDGLRGSQGRWS